MIKIKYVPFGIGSRAGDTIFLNKALKKHPGLHDAILRHEEAHTSGYSWSDTLLDLRNTHLKDRKLEYYKFILKNPSSLSEFLPVWRSKGVWLINPLILLLYGSVLVLLGIIGGLWL